MLESGATLLAGAVEDLIRQVIQTVLAWIKQLEDAIQTLADAIASLAQAIQGLLAAAQQAFAQVAQELDTLLGEFAEKVARLIEDT